MSPLAPGPCPDLFSACAAPNVPLGLLLAAVPGCGTIAALGGGAVLLWKGARRTSLRAFLVPLVLAVVPLVLHARFVPDGPMVFYDEFLHAETSANLADGTGPFPCCTYDAGRCVPGGPILWPVTTQEGTAVLLRLTGTSGVSSALQLRSVFNRIASAASGPLAWGWTLLLLGDPWAAAFAGLVVAVWPGALRLQTTADLTPGAVGCLLLLLCAVEAYRRRPGLAAAVAVSGCLALALHARLEMALVTPWLLWRLAGSGPLRMRLLILLAWILILAPLVWLYVDGTAHHAFGWEASRDRAVDFVSAHAGPNLRFFFEAEGALPALLPLALVGTLFGVHRALLPLLATAVGWFLFVSAYHSGDFRLSGSDGFRYAVAIAALLSPAAGWAVGAIAQRLRGLLRPVVFGVAVALLVLQLPTALPFLARENIVAQSDHAVRAWAIHHPWESTETVVSRSVAYSRAITGAPGILERCSPLRASSHLWYLRSWNDPGPSVVPGVCPAPEPGTAESGDGLGPWLFRYGPCTVEAISPAPDRRR